MDAYDASTSSGADIIQWGCHSKCADAWQEGIEQWSCGYEEQPVHILDVQDSDVYTLRPTFLDDGECYDVPNGSQDSGVQIIRYSCHEEDNERWYITPFG